MNISKVFDFTQGSNTKGDYETIEKYLNQLQPHSGTTSVDDLIKQLSDVSSKHFTRIVLFSTKGPKRTCLKDIFVDWVSPFGPEHYENENDPINVDGLFLCAPQFSEGYNDQLKLLIKHISKDNIFNVSMTSYVTNYKIHKKQKTSSTANEFFSKKFRLTPKSVDSHTNTAMFGVETTYIRFTKSGKSYFDTIWSTQEFRKSSDFIPVISSTNPMMMIPHLNRNRNIRSFISLLMENYKKKCLSQMCGIEDEDKTFSLIPELQWFLRFEYGLKNKTWMSRMCIPIYCNFDSKFSRYYPNVSLWIDPQNKIEERCPLSEYLYRLVGSPKLAVVDFVSSIEIFSDDLTEIPKKSELNIYIKKAKKNRFPKTELRFRKLNDFVDMLMDTKQFYDFISNEFKS
ncbi:hypothetical protein GPJ56_007162 [Histomonas meleagridis]|uniref:uncharacterized protein n=1 Tax=Histomonas meleagridis TaxID=135588 RepID=UPI00355AA814|nr:hypothetical protein GPJ56_007162 [Histomonas meleagridis]KAH0806174.1 hypothetical protein GO595_000862 [Histomonas meleagridis]